LLLDLLTLEEEKVDNQTREHRFDITLLSNKLVYAINWVAANNPDIKGLTIGLFGASTGAAAALVAHEYDKCLMKIVIYNDRLT
jgi:putative phosphoribosyl transferase